MNSAKAEFLSLPTKPGRLTPEETAWLLGFKPEAIPILIAALLLKPLGRPRRSSVKYFALVVVLELHADAKWLSKATEAMQIHYDGKNHKKHLGGSDDEAVS
jgi:hypothetical protein